MDIDASTVTSLVGLGAGIVAIFRTSNEAKAKAYNDARKDLGDCKKTSEAQSKKIDDLSGQVDILGTGLNHCIERHEAAEAKSREAAEKAEAAERLSLAMRVEMDALRRSIGSER